MDAQKCAIFSWFKEKIDRKPQSPQRESCLKILAQSFLLGFLDKKTFVEYQLDKLEFYCYGKIKEYLPYLN